MNFAVVGSHIDQAVLDGRLGDREDGLVRDVPQLRFDVVCHVWTDSLPCVSPVFRMEKVLHSVVDIVGVVRGDDRGSHPLSA
ncbi:hypothetical protein ES703_59866 [subsurface metagenome]